MVLLLRHPCAVAHSRVETKAWRWNLEGYRDQPSLFGEILAPFADHVHRDLPLFDRHVTNWCIEYYVPFRELRRREVHVLFYEDLCLRPEKEARALLDYLGRPWAASVEEALERPSRVSRSGSAIRTGEDLARSWRAHVSEAEAARAREIMALFGLDVLYDEDDLPRSEALGSVFASD
jgi:hypothetical protein